MLDGLPEWPASTLGSQIFVEEVMGGFWWLVVAR